jgi:hypothetical protein
MLRRHWRHVALGLLSWVALTAAFTVLMSLIVNGSVGLVTFGVCIGVLVTFSTFYAEVTDPEGRRLRWASDAEEWTAQELGRLRGAGCRVISNLNFATGDVDHVVVGPFGVAIVETKRSDGTWDFVVRERATGWSRQAVSGSLKVRSLIKQRARVEVTPHAFICLWAMAAPDAPVVLPGGVTLVHGRGIHNMLSALNQNQLDSASINRIADALQTAASEFDAAQGVQHDSIVRRLSPLA